MAQRGKRNIREEDNENMESRKRKPTEASRRAEEAGGHDDVHIKPVDMATQRGERFKASRWNGLAFNFKRS
jgi:hypothetical protein